LADDKSTILNSLRLRMEHPMHARKQTVRERPLHYFSINLAIVEANSGESNEEAWRRHLVQHPQDRQANVKIFNRGSATRS
jgi:hypothetical protein